MAEKPKDLREELELLKFKHNIFQKIDCSEQENKEYSEIIENGGTLPDNTYRHTDSFNFYHIYKTDISQEELQEYLSLKKLSYIRTIKNCAVFFVILTVISIIIILGFSG